MLAGSLLAGRESAAQPADLFKADTVESVSKHVEASTETPATTTVITRDEIERYGFRTLADVVNFASLGSFSLNDRRWELAGSRGVFLFEDYNTRILVMLNGHPVNEPWGNFGDIGRAMLVPLDLVERIEIVYGPSALLYGGYSLFGIVNVVTRSGATLPGTRLRLSGGSWRTGEAVASWGASGAYGDEMSRSGEWSVLAAAGYYSTRGEDLDLPLVEVDYPVDLAGSTLWGGPQSGTDFERSPFAFVHARRGDFSLLGRVGYRNRGSPFAPYKAIYGSVDQTQRDAKGFGQLRFERALEARTDLVARVFHDAYSYKEQDPYADATTYPGQPGYFFTLENSSRDTGVELRLNHRRGTHYLTLGGEFRTRSFDWQTANRLFDGTLARSSGTHPATGRFAVVYAQEEWRPTGWLSLIAGGNWADTHPGGSTTLPRLGAILKPRRDLSLKALYGRGFRPPSSFEATYADYQGNLPNPALRAEEISSGELSVLWNPAADMTLQGYAFKSVLTDLIDTVTIEQPEDVQGGVVGPGGTTEELVGQLQYQSSGKVRSSGVGAALQRRGRRLHAYANVAYASASREPQPGETSPLPASARWLASAGASWSARDWTISAAARYVGPHPLDASRGGGTAGDFVEANLRALYRTRLVYPLTFQLDVRNVFGSAGTMAASPVFTPPRLPIEGRRLLLGAEVSF
jgi:iron complex outermembrane receptor protein